MSEYYENSILERYLLMAVQTIEGAVIGRKHFNFRCNVCGDSKNKRKKRGHLRYSKSPKTFKMYWTYKCFNEGDCECAGSGNAISASSWLKRFYPHLHHSYMMEIIEKKVDAKDIEKQNINHIKQYEIEKKKEDEAKLKAEINDIQYFKPISTDSELGHIATALCEKRKIPEDIWKKFYVCGKGKYYNRMIIPFYDNNNEIYYFQARLLVDNDYSSKYINRNCNKDNSCYNIYNVDKDKPVMVLEGPIDSMMVENSIATLGLGISEKMQSDINSMDSYYIFDDDKAGKNITLDYLRDGKNVFNWMQFRKDLLLPDRKKWDFNDVYIYLNRTEAFDFNELEKYFTNNFYDSIYFE